MALQLLSLCMHQQGKPIRKDLGTQLFEAGVCFEVLNEIKGQIVRLKISMQGYRGEPQYIL